MTQNYNRPRQRARTFGAGLLSGTAVMQEDVMNKLKENLNFRVESAREMLMGQTRGGSVGPMERRMQIRENRLSLLGMGGPDSDDSDSQNGSSARATSGSGSIGQSGTSSSGSRSGSVSSSTPSMSEVESGTKARAQDRGFGT